MRIVDSQIHVWEEDRPERPWPPGARSSGHRLHNPLGPDEVLGWMDSIGIDGAVLIPPSWAGDWNVVVRDAVEAHPDRFAAMGRVNVDEPRSAESLRELIDEFKLTGFRMTFIRGPIIEQLRGGQLEW